MINIIRQILVKLHFQQMPALWQHRPLLNIFHEEAVKRRRRGDIHIKGHTHIAFIADVGSAEILHDHFRLHQHCLLLQKHAVQEGRIIRSNRDRLHSAHLLILFTRDPAALFLDHAVFLALAFQRNPAVTAVVDTHTPFFTRAHAALVLVQAPVVEIVEIGAPDQIASALVRMRIRLHDILKPHFQHFQFSYCYSFVPVWILKALIADRSLFGLTLSYFDVLNNNYSHWGIDLATSTKTKFVHYSNAVMHMWRVIGIRYTSSVSPQAV